MSRNPFVSVVFAAAAVGALLLPPFAASAANPSRATTAINTAAANGKYLFVFFWKTDDAQSQTMSKVFQQAMANMTDLADSIGIQITDTSEKAIVEEFGVSRAPMPLVLALAPNGAITKGFPIKFDEAQLRQALVSPATANCMKALQDRKLVLLCIQNGTTEGNREAMRGVEAFKADKRYAQATEIITLNPNDRAETSFLNDLKVDPRTTEAVTVLLAPPGSAVARFTGAVTKDQIVAKVQAGPCAGGKCGPGGCCPK